MFNTQANASLLEKHHSKRQEFQSSFCFGRITKVNVDDRMCEVRTIGEGNLNDCFLTKVQWLSTDCHPDGDESGAIPRVNTYGLVFFVGGEPFIWGYYSPLNNKGQATRDQESREQFTEGDRFMITEAGNKIIVRSSGEIQIEANSLCRTIYLPDQGLIDRLCKNYEHRCDGGTISWVNTDDDLGSTYYRQEYLNNIDRSVVVVEERGTMVDETDYISRSQVGSGADDGGIENQVWSYSLKATGEAELFIRAPGSDIGYNHTIYPDGKSILDVAGKTIVTTMPTGEVSLDVCKKAKLVVSPSGMVDLNIADKVKLNMTPAGVTTVDSSGSKMKLSDGKVGIGSSSVELLAKIVEQLEKISAYCDTAQTHTHIGNMGYPTAPPTDPSPWTTLKSAMDSIKGDITSIKGGV